VTAILALPAEIARLTLPPLPGLTGISPVAVPALLTLSAGATGAFPPAG
jgi:hypothetical protein